jgi:hypothetical protein
VLSASRRTNQEIAAGINIYGICWGGTTYGEGIKVYTTCAIQHNIVAGTAGVLDGWLLLKCSWGYLQCGKAGFKGFDALHCFLKRLDCFHVEHRVVDALGDGAEITLLRCCLRVALIVENRIAICIQQWHLNMLTIWRFANETRRDKLRFLSNQTDLSVRLAFLEVVLADLKSFNVGPLGGGVKMFSFNLMSERAP